jgi:hypothetical protein
MTDDADAWAVALKIPSDDAAEFDRLTACGSLCGETTPPTIRMLGWTATQGRGGIEVEGSYD